MDKNITSKFNGDATDLYVELAGDLYELCQKYANLGTTDEVIHGSSVMAHNFDKVLNEFESLIIKFDKGKSKREQHFRETAITLSTDPDGVTEENPNGLVDTKKFETVMENLCLVEKYYSEGKVEKADAIMLDFINYLHNSNETFYGVYLVVKDLVGYKNF
jgi:hypothetical protein